MAELTRETIHALALDVLAQVKRLDADTQDMLAEVRAMRARSEAFCASLADRSAAVRQAH